jgi:pyruvate dehydrogenase E1 component
MAALPENALSASISDADPQETQEWQDALSGVIEKEGAERAHFLIEGLIAQARQEGIDIPTAPPPNTSTPFRSIGSPSTRAMPTWKSGFTTTSAGTPWRWSCGPTRTATSAAISPPSLRPPRFTTSAFSWFWRASSEQHGGDLIFFQGHSVPGVYARAHLLGRLTDEQMDCFRQEVDGKGISSYPHPWLMPDFWQFPTVSMGLGPIQAIYQARFMKYLDSRGFMAKAGDRKVWAFLGDGETDEVESLGAIGMAAREKLDNLIFVINCNLQRLDGPVRGNGKIIQELEGTSAAPAGTSSS